MHSVHTVMTMVLAYRARCKPYSGNDWPVPSRPQGRGKRAHDGDPEDGVKLSEIHKATSTSGSSNSHQLQIRITRIPILDISNYAKHRSSFIGPRLPACRSKNRASQWHRSPCSSSAAS